MQVYGDDPDGNGLSMIQIQSLGGINLQTQDGTPIRLRSRKHVGLLLYLAMSGRQMFTREHLTSLFWTSRPERARHSLSQAAYDLRTHLHGALVRGSGEQLALDGRNLEFDAIEFEAALKEGRLGAAIDLYRGPFAQNLTGAGTAEFDRWVETERLRLRRLAEVTFRRFAAECESKGRWGEMCVAAMRLTDMTPLDEEAHLSLMRGLWLHGDPTAALKHFDVADALLRQELPSGPTDRLMDLADKIRSAPTANPMQLGTSERETPFLGREVEYDTLRAAVRAMGTTRTTAVLIAGEAGIGKSRLVREFSRSLALQQVRLIESRCYPAEEELPYGPIVDAVSPIAKEVLAGSGGVGRFPRLGYLLPDFPRKPVPEDEGVDPAAWRRRLYEEVASLLRVSMEDRPIVWIIDDAQWIDATSAGLLHYVSRRLEGTRFLLVVTVRAPRAGRLPAKLPVTPPDGSGYTQEIRLPPLTSEQIRELVLHGRPDATLHPAVEIAQRLSAGNPFYAMEVFLAAMAATDWAQTMRDWDPLNDERLRYVLAVRFKGLPETATRLLQCVAVLERAATPRIVAAVSGLDLDSAADESAELYARGLLHDDENRLDFVNDIMRDYVYSEMSGMRRASLHLRAARQLEQEPDPSPGKLARHFQLGDEPTFAYRYAMEAAQRASRSGGHTEAAVMATLARNTASNSEEELAALEIMAESELASAQLASAREHFNEILRLQPELPPEEQIRVKLKMVECLGAASDWPSARAILQQLAPTLRKVQLGTVRTELRIEANVWGVRAATRTNSSRLAKKHACRIQRAWNSELREHHLSNVGETNSRYSLAAYELFYGSLSKALDLPKPLETDNPQLSKDLQFRIQLLQAFANLRAARWDRARLFGSRALASAARAGDLVQQANALNNMLCVSLESGDWEAANTQLGMIEEKLDALAAAHDATLPLGMNKANVLFYQGRPADALSRYLECRRLARQNSIQEFDPELVACVGLTALQLGDQKLISESWAALSAFPPDSLLGVQERFKIEWFRSFMRLKTDDPADVSNGLRELAADYADKDCLEAGKLAWLGFLLGNQWNQEDSWRLELERLGALGIGWFAFFSRRWRRQVHHS